MKKLLLALLVVATGAVMSDVVAGPRSACATCSTCNKPARDCGCPVKRCAPRCAPKPIRTANIAPKPCCMVDECRTRKVTYDEPYTVKVPREPIQVVHTDITWACEPDCEWGNADEANRMNGVDANADKPAKAGKKVKKASKVTRAPKASEIQG